MKNNFSTTKLFLFLLVPLLFFQNCSNDATEDTVDLDLINIENSPVVEKLIEMGYKKEDIQELDGFYLVQGDILFSKNISDYKKKKGAQGGRGGLYARHAHTNNLVSQTNVTSMTVYVDPSVSVSGIDDWSAAINDARDDLNGISGSVVNFIITTNSNADIIIESDNGALPNNVIASAGFPLSNQPWNTVLINLDFLSNMNVTGGTKRYNMVHELGHCIGLRHTNWETNDSTTNVGAHLIPGTPTQDLNSVMNGGTATNSWNGFSSFDIVAIEYLYPVPPPPIILHSANGTSKGQRKSSWACASTYTPATYYFEGVSFWTLAVGDVIYTNSLLNPLNGSNQWFKIHAWSFKINGSGVILEIDYCGVLV